MLSPWKKLVFALTAIALVLGIAAAALAAVDIYLHRKYMDLVGLNVWGYRGPAIGPKQSGEWRLAMLGGSTAFGYGVHWTEAIPAYLETELKQHSASGGPARVINLAFNGEGAHAYPYALEDYRYLDLDAVLLYSGYNDLLPNSYVFRRESAVFRWTGYLPLLPMIAQEKAMAIRYNGRLEDAYQGEKTTFKPNLAQRATAGALEAAVHISETLDRQLSAGESDSKMKTQDGAMGIGRDCGDRYAHYCGETLRTIDLALARRMSVVIVTPPYINGDHIEQEALLRALLKKKYGAHPKLHFVDLGRLIDLTDRSLCYDGVHLNARGNRMVAAAIAPHVVPLVNETRPAQR